MEIPASRNCKTPTEYHRDWRNRNREHVREYQRKWRKEHAESMRASRKKWADAHPDYREKWIDEHSEQYDFTRNRWAKNNREKINPRMRRWYKKNRELAASGDRAALRRVIKSVVSGGITARLKKRQGGKGRKSTFDFLPYSVDELMAHLESKFEPGMSWKNYGRGGWVIDHIIPDCSFDYSSVEDAKFQECWALSNLQPLWFEDNARKHARMPEEWAQVRVRAEGPGSSQSSSLA